jgi:hypothetical protein
MFIFYIFNDRLVRMVKDFRIIILYRHRQKEEVVAYFQTLDQS